MTTLKHDPEDSGLWECWTSLDQSTRAYWRDVTRRMTNRGFKENLIFTLAKEQYYEELEEYSSFIDGQIRDY